MYMWKHDGESWTSRQLYLAAFTFRRLPFRSSTRFCRAQRNESSRSAGVSPDVGAAGRIKFIRHDRQRDDDDDDDDEPSP